MEWIIALTKSVSRVETVHNYPRPGNSKLQDLVRALRLSKVKIFADETKTYRSIKLIEDNEEYTNWLMVDDKGLKCYLSVGVHKETKLSYLKIEYVDTVILYFTKPN